MKAISVFGVILFVAVVLGACTNSNYDGNTPNDGCRGDECEDAKECGEDCDEENSDDNDIEEDELDIGDDTLPCTGDSCGTPTPLPPSPSVSTQGNQYGFDSKNTGRSPYVGPQTNNLQWKYIKEGRDTKCQGFQITITSVILDESDILYFGTSKGDVVALTQNQEELWRFTLPDAYERTVCGDTALGGDLYALGTLYDLNIDAPVALDSSSVYFATSGAANAPTLYSLNKKTGVKQWSFSLPNSLKSKITLADGRLYFGTGTEENSRLHSLSTAGNDFRTYSEPTKLSGGAPAVANGQVYYCAKDKLVALDLNLNKIWDYPFGVERLGVCFITISADNTIYLPVSHEKKLYAFDENGVKQWSVDTFWSESAVALGPDGTLHLTGTDQSNVGGNQDATPLRGGNGRLIAITPSGTVKWLFKVPSIKWQTPSEGGVPGKEVYDNTGAADGTPIVGADGTIYFGTDARHFFAINADGTEKWRISQGIFEFDRTSVIASDGTLYFAPAGFVGGGFFAVKDDTGSPSDGSTNQPCNSGAETGKTCDTANKCSTGEYINGCCIGGTCTTNPTPENPPVSEPTPSTPNTCLTDCLATGESQAECEELCGTTPAWNEACTVGAEAGKTCDSESKCSTGEFANGCCIGGTCR